MEPKGSLPHSQVLTTNPYPEPARSNPYPHIPHGPVNSPKCDKCKQAHEKASHILCDCEA
jgi:hypothetical protein